MRRTGTRWEWILSLTALLALPSVLIGQDAVPTDQQVSFLLRAVSYDRNLTGRSAKGIRVGVVYRGDEKGAAEVADAFNKAGQGGVKGLSVTAIAVPLESVGELLKRVDAEGLNAVYVHASAATALSSIQQVTRGKKIPSLGGTKDLADQGASLGVYLLDGAPKLVVNLRASQVEGLDLGAELLGISTVIK